MWNKNAFNICATTHISLCLFGLSVNVLSVMCLHKLGLLGCFHTWTSSELSCRINCRWYLLLMVLSKSRFGQEKHERSVKWKSTGWFYEKRCQGNRMLFIIMRNSLGIRTGNTQFWRNAILSFSSQMNRIKIAFFCETHTQKNLLKQIKFLLNPQCSGSDCMLFQSVQDILKNIYQHYR